MSVSFKFKNYSAGTLAILTATLLGCGGGGDGRDPILGANVALVPTPAPAPAPVPVPPGGTCASPTPAMPTVTQSNPTNGNQFAATSTSGVAGGGAAIAATFSLPMNAATITAANFSLTPAASPALTPASVAYDAVTRVATYTTASALLPNTVYNVVVAKAVASAAGTSMGCDFAWAFKTAAAAVTAPPAAAFNLGRASSFAIAATAGVTNTPTLPLTAIVGDVVLSPTATCNAVAVDNIGGFGLCGGSPPTIVGTVVTPTFPDTTRASNVQADLRATYLSLTPPAGPPAAGSLGGGTPIAAPTSLGAPTGSAAVPGTNVFFPGVYTSTTSILVSNDLTLDAQGNADAVFVFQSASTVGTAPNGRILLINGAKASNVWWQVGSSATLNTNTTWQGNILAAASITMNTGATSCGRLLAGAFTAGAFVFDKNVVNVPGNPASPPTCL